LKILRKNALPVGQRDPQSPYDHRKWIYVAPVRFAAQARCAREAIGDEGWARVWHCGVYPESSPHGIDPDRRRAKTCTEHWAEVRPVRYLARYASSTGSLIVAARDLPWRRIGDGDVTHCPTARGCPMPPSSPRSACACLNCTASRDRCSRFAATVRRQRSVTCAIGRSVRSVDSSDVVCRFRGPARMRPPRGAHENPRDLKVEAGLFTANRRSVLDTSKRLPESPSPTHRPRCRSCREGTLGSRRHLHLGRYAERWPVFKRPSVTGFGCPPRKFRTTSLKMPSALRLP